VLHKSEQHRTRDHRCAQHLRPAQAKDGPAQSPEQRRSQLQADQEQHHHHAELGEVHHIVRFIPEQAEHCWSNRYAGQQVAKHEPSPSRFANGTETTAAPR